MKVAAESSWVFSFVLPARASGRAVMSSLAPVVASDSYRDCFVVSGVIWTFS